MAKSMFYDRQKITSREMTDNGYLKAPAYLARTGMYQYTGKELGLHPNEHLKIFNVFRPEKEVFKRSSLKSFSNLPVTNNHPNVMLNNQNTKRLGVGYSGDHITKDGDYVKADLIITDKTAIDDIMKGKTEISLGYVADYRAAEPGEDCDFVQQNIKGNHIALVDGGRAGEECAIMDSNINIKPGVQNTMSKETNSMKEATVTPKTDNVDLDKDSAANVPKSKPSIKEMMQDEGVTLDQKVNAMFDHFMDALEALKKPDKEGDETGNSEKKSEKKEGEPGKSKGPNMDKKKSKDEDMEEKKEKESKDTSSVEQEANESNKESAIDKKKKSMDAMNAEIDTLRAAIPTTDQIHAMAAELMDIQKKAHEYASDLTIDSGANVSQIKEQVVKHRFSKENFDNKSLEYMDARFDSLKYLNSPNNYMSNQISKATQDRAITLRDNARLEMMKRKENAWNTEKKKSNDIKDK